MAIVSEPFEAYFDDSGTQPEAPVFIWAGYIAKKGTWNEFNVEWNRILAESPPIPYWHTSHAHCLKEPFGVLTRGEMEEREERLAGLIRDAGDLLYGIIARLPHISWERHVRGKVQSQDSNVIEKPQTVCFHEASTAAIGASGYFGGNAAPVHFFYEHREGDDYEDHVHSIYARMTQNRRLSFRHRLGLLTFAPGKSSDARPLEAADMLAWNVNYRARREGDYPTWEILEQTRMVERTPRAPELADYVSLWS